MIPGPDLGAVDKLIHFTAYLGLAIGLRVVTNWQGSLIVRVLIAYAAMDELTQMMVGRNADFRDWLADVLGIAVGLLVASWAQRLRATSATPSR